MVVGVILSVRNCGATKKYNVGYTLLMRKAEGGTEQEGVICAAALGPKD